MLNASKVDTKNLLNLSQNKQNLNVKKIQLIIRTPMQKKPQISKLCMKKFQELKSVWMISMIRLRKSFKLWKKMYFTNIYINKYSLIRFKSKSKKKEQNLTLTRKQRIIMWKFLKGKSMKDSIKSYN